MSPQWIVVLVLIALVWFLFVKKKPLPNEKASTTKKKKEKLDEDDMVECISCGTYISLSEALLRDGKYFCSDECLKG